MRKVEVILAVIGALATITKNYDKWIKKLDLELKIEALKYPYSLGTTRITRKEKKKEKKSYNTEDKIFTRIKHQI